MTLLFLILIILFCVLLGLVVLIQNPKGGGLAGTFGGFSNQFMGVKQTTDVLEKGTWIFAAAIGILCIVSTVFMKGANDNQFIKGINTNQQQQTLPLNTPAEGQQAPAGETTPAPAAPQP